MRRLRGLAVLLAGALTVAACSTVESSAAVTDPDQTLPSIATTTVPPPTTVPPTTTTPEPPPTTTAAPTTTAPPTTTTTVAPPVSVPTDATVPLVVGGGSGGGWLPIGSWTGTGWGPAVAEDGTPLDPGVAPGTELTIVGLQAGATSGVAGAGAEACFDERVGPTVDTPVAVPAPPGFGYSALALPTPTWPLQPRPVVVITADIPSYQAAGEAALAAAPVDATLGRVEQILLADLDGDGDEESVVVFEHLDTNSIVGAPGDLAALLLIDTASGTSTTVDSMVVVADEAGEPTTIRSRFRILDIADLNGDGTMEVVVHRWYFEGAAALVYEYDGSSLDEALSTGCGA